MKRVLLAGVICLSLGHTIGTAQARRGGPGNLSCGLWNAAAAQRGTATGIDRFFSDRANRAWTYGFVTGAAYISDPPLTSIDEVAVDAWMNAYCAAHPADRIANGAALLVEELRRDTR